jgi:membrane protease YdiL (CAAX protease family)
MKRFAVQNPIAFSLLVTVSFFMLMSGAFILGARMSDIPHGKNIGEFVGKILVSVIIMIVLRRFRWLKGAGVTRPGSGRSWLALSIPLVYAVLSTTYALTGGLQLSFSDPGQYSWITANMMGGGLAEEIVFRGLIFFCLLTAWRIKTNAALLGGIMSAVIFGYSHLVWVLLGKELSLGLLQSTAAFFSGIFYAGVWIQTRSLWPPVVIHGLTNALVYIKISEMPDFNETITGGIMDITLGLPLAVYGVFFLWKYSKRNVLSQDEEG